MNFIIKLKVQHWVQFAPAYATFSMGYFEIKLYSVCTFSYGELLHEYIKENWNRSLDDCYAVLRSSQISPEELLLTLNSINPSIQFTVEYSKAQIPFLDILIKTPKGVCLLHPVVQTIVNEISHFV